MIDREIDDFIGLETQVWQALVDGVVLAYRAIFTRRSGTDVSEPEAMYVSSLWCRRDNRWVNLFSQDTPVPMA